MSEGELFALTRELGRPYARSREAEPAAAWSELRSGVRRLLRESYETSSLPTAHGADIVDGTGLSVLLGASRAYRVSDTTTAAFTKAIALVGALAVSGALRNLLIAGTTFDILRTLRDGFESIIDPDEQDVLAAVVSLKAIEIRDFDALRARSLTQAFREVGPNEAEIIQHLDKDPIRSRLALARVVQRGLVEADGTTGRYHIRL